MCEGSAVGWWRAGTMAGFACMAAVSVSGCGGPGGAPPATSSPGGLLPDSPASGLSPVARIFDQIAVEDGVRRVLTESYGVARVGAVRCPSGESVQPGISFDCAVHIGQTDKSVTLTVRGVDGTYEVSAPQ